MDKKFLNCCNKLFKNLQAVSLHHKKSSCGGEELIKKELINLHYNKKMSQRDIAKEWNLTNATVNHMFKRFNIVGRKWTTWNKGMSGAQVAWNKGLTKDDPRVKKYVDNSRRTKREKSFKINNLNTFLRGMPEYKKWRSAIYKKDGYKSVLSAQGGSLNAHHKIKLSQLIARAAILSPDIMSNDYEIVELAAKNFKPFWDINNGVTLLEKEHRELHKNDVNEGVVIITGAEGQDGSLLSDYLLGLGYQVIGITRRSGVHEISSNLSFSIDHESFKIEFGDITDESFIHFMIQKYKPEIYFNLAAMSHVGQSFKEPLKTFRNNASAVISALEAIRRNSPKTRFYQASTSEIFGGLTCPSEGYTEDSSFHPRSPYGVAKMAAYWAVINYREAYGLFACNGILFNHSSTRRGYDFATRKITRGIAKVKLGIEDNLKMGNLESFRDEAHAKDMIRGMHLIMLNHNPGDFVLATGDGATIKEMFEYVCDLAGLKIKDVYEQDARFMRPSEVPYLKGCPDKANIILGWQPEYTWKDLLKEMYLSDLESLQSEGEL